MLLLVIARKRPEFRSSHPAGLYLLFVSSDIAVIRQWYA